jgi:hypothetical protein
MAARSTKRLRRSIGSPGRTHERIESLAARGGSPGRTRERIESLLLEAARGGKPMSGSSRRLLEALRSPKSIGVDYPHWEALIRCAREADLLGTLAWRITQQGELNAVPPAPRAHLVAARIRGAAQLAATHREVREIGKALERLDVPVILLKGAAYALAALPPSHGRLFSDIDILVPKRALADVESALMLAGFATTHLHPYDQRYYRRWMHELPPMRHVKRASLLDVHHTLIPETAHVALDARKLFRAAVPVADMPRVFALSPADMVLHSATHLFHNEELSHGLRDLVDVDALLDHFARANSEFWPALVERAAELDLERPLYYALRFAPRLLGTKVPDDVVASVARHAPPLPLRPLMDRLLAAALEPAYGRASTRWARRALYVRGHWLKMPLPLLAWHLTIKALRREEVTPA